MSRVWQRTQVYYISGLIILARAGLEHMASQLLRECSTNELPRPVRQKRHSVFKLNKAITKCRLLWFKKLIHVVTKNVLNQILVKQRKIYFLLHTKNITFQLNILMRSRTKMPALVKFC